MTEHNLSLRELLEQQFDRYAAPVPAVDTVADVETEMDLVPPVETETVVVTETPVTVDPDEEWVVQTVKSHCDKCAAKGFKSPVDWIRHLITVDAALEENPAETINYLARVYGVKIPGKEPTNPMVERLIERHKKRACDVIDRVVRAALCPDGTCRYPHYNDVRDEMFRLIDCGAAHSIDEAYDQAVWLTGNVRDKVIHERADALLAERVQEAEKAKEASFRAMGKSCGAVSEEVPSIRTLLERAFTKAGIYH